VSQIKVKPEICMSEWLNGWVFFSTIQEDVLFFNSRQYCTLFFCYTSIAGELVNKLLRDLDRFHAK